MVQGDLEGGCHAAKKIKKNAEKIAQEIGEDLSRIDVEKESLELMKGIETAFTSIGEELRRKREEMEKSGVSKTVKKDAKNIKKTSKKVAEEVLESLEKASSDIRKYLKENE